MSPEDWDQSPWWYTVSLIEGLKADGTLSDGSQSEGMPTGSPHSTGNGERTYSVDLSGSGPVPRGFTTRRVG